MEELTGDPPAPPHELVLENAYRKAAAVAERRGRDGLEPGLVLGVDTIVALGSRIYGKPAGRQSAGDTLRALRGRRHAVISGVCVIDRGGPPRTAAATTAVSFARFDDATLEWYLDSGEWRERAGGYAIQGRGAALVAAIEGDYLNVVGLPVQTLLELVPGLLS